MEDNYLRIDVVNVEKRDIEQASSTQLAVVTTRKRKGLFRLSCRNSAATAANITLTIHAMRHAIPASAPPFSMSRPRRMKRCGDFQLPDSTRRESARMRGKTTYRRILQSPFFIV
eukprot:3366381-Rhodomonas_salina.2